MWFISCCKSVLYHWLVIRQRNRLISQSIGSIILWKTVLVARHNIYYGCTVWLALDIPGLARTGTKLFLATRHLWRVYIPYTCVHKEMVKWSVFICEVHCEQTSSEKSSCRVLHSRVGPSELQVLGSSVFSSCISTWKCPVFIWVFKLGITTSCSNTLEALRTPRAIALQFANIFALFTVNTYFYLWVLIHPHFSPFLW